MTSTVSVRIDNKDKIEFEKLCENFGLSVSSAISVFVKKVISARAIPFTISEDAFYSEYNQNRIKKSLKKAVAGKYQSHKLGED